MRFCLVCFIIFVKILFFPQQISAQENSINDFINVRNYDKAIEVILLKGSVENLNEMFLEKLGYCYIMTRQYIKAEEVYAKLVDTKNPSIENLKYYAETLMINLKYDKAKEYLNRCRESNHTDKQIEIKIASCDSLKLWQNLESGSLIRNFAAINTQYDEMCAYSTPSDFVYLTTRETELSAKEPRNFITASQFIVKGFKPSQIDSSKTVTTENIVSQLNKSHIAKEYWCSSFSFCKERNLYAFALKKIQRWTHDISLGNSMIVFDGLEDGSIDSLMVFKWDGMPANINISQPGFAKNGTRLYFSSDMPGGYGGMDLYYSDLVMDVWTKPKNLGGTVNTPFDELSPTIIGDTILYFSSNGLPGYGNFDVYCSVIHSDNFEKPINMKAPINSIGDELYFQPDFGNNWFLTSNRSPIGKGGYDVYFVNRPCSDEPKDDHFPPIASKRELNIQNYKLPFLLFNFDEAIIDENYDESLKNLADTLKLFNDIKLTILGHTDNLGSIDYNLKLSESRAKAVADKLISRGVSESQISYKGMGVSEDNRIDDIRYTVILKTLKSSDYTEWVKEKLDNKHDVFVLSNGKYVSYCIGNFENAEDAAKLLQKINSGYFSKSHVGAFYFGRCLPKYNASINRRVDLRLRKSE